MSEPIVLELQRLASDSTLKIGDLVRKALIVATKLNRADFVEWLHHELHGYTDADKVPDYRRIRAQLQVHNPYRGYQPFLLDDSDLEDKLCSLPVMHPVTEIESLLASGKPTFDSPFPGHITAMLMRAQESIAPLPPVRRLHRASFETIVEAVRTAILEWALRLEQEGIVGEGFSFSPQEKTKAALLPGIQIENFQGILGDVTNSNVEQRLKLTVTAGDFASLQSYLVDQLGIPSAEVSALREALQSDPQPNDRQSLGPKTRTWLGSMLVRIASGSSGVAVGATGDLLAQAIWRYLGL